MKKLKVSRNIDTSFILKISAILVLFLLIGLFVPKDTEAIEYEISDLPETFEGDFHKLLITEVLSNNGGVYVNEYNEQTDYLELYNGTGADIDLTGYGLSDKVDRIRFVFPKCVIASKSYLVISLSGNTEEGLNAPFKLASSGKERIILVNKKNKVIDGVDTVALQKNQVMIRNQSGQWSISNMATPGFENSIAGHDAYLASLTQETETDLVVNEILLRNKGNFINEYGDLCGFIEFKNISDHILNLKDYSISDDSNAVFKTSLPDLYLSPNEVKAIYLGKGNAGQENYLGSNFSNDSSRFILSRKGRILQNIAYGNVENGYSLQYDGKGYYLNSTVSYDQDNTAEGIEAFAKKYLNAPKGLVISEVMSNNPSYLPHNGNKTYDWI